MQDATTQGAATLLEFSRRHRRLAVLSGAGLSTGSGIPDYRDENGEWKHKQPLQYADFIASDLERRRYWARSFAAWDRFRYARPNGAHTAIAALQRAGRISCLITQNVDDLHRAAGSRDIVDLHGVLNRVRCLGCGAVSRRQRMQQRLRNLNSNWAATVRAHAPDGDAILENADYARFKVPSCSRCQGVLKPDVVFFGEAVPAERVRSASERLARCDALLVVGSSLMVWSGYRFVKKACESGQPVAIVNRGRTRADDMAAIRIHADCGTLLPGLARQLGAI